MISSMVPGTRWRVAVASITPDEAERLLHGNTGNRRMRGGVVERYTAVMREGSWIATPQPIIIGTDGRLLNGQHRLQAVITSGITCQFMIVSDVGEEVFRTLDRGVMRSTGDAIGKSRELVGAAKMIMEHVYQSSDPMTDTRAEAMIALIEPTFSDLLLFSNRKSRYFSSTSFRTAASLRVMGGADRQYVFDLFDDLCGAHIPKLPPIAQSLISAAATGSINTIGHSARRDLLARAWDVFDVTKANNVRVVIKSSVRHMEEMRAVIEAAKYLPLIEEAAS